MKNKNQYSWTISDAQFLIETNLIKLTFKIF